ncbi:RNA ligase family protein [Roseibium sp. MMSF_3544]|uniref:RNA ligase family protein n=1 Tax=unclassified Roseibium TaxID=2629323 RepID=UPI00273D8B99|nr:RNA ligase family protein [Roseibium sp. MMSF_3544]
MELLKYPRTRHLEGSRLQEGDLGDDKPIAELADQFLVIEEKIDGANCAVSFDPEGTLRLQSRGHFLVGGYRERHFDLLKTWASVHANALSEVLGRRYIMFGEWLYAKHTSFYDRLPHYFLEFDVFDRETGRFLSTAGRRRVLGGLPVMPVPVLHEGAVSSVEDLRRLIKPSLYKSAGWRNELERSAEASKNRLDMVERQTEDTDLAEGLYVKSEDEDYVLDRFKFVRADFVQAITDSDGHWQSRPILPNQLAADTDIFAPVLGVKGAYDEV